MKNTRAYSSLFFLAALVLLSFSTKSQTEQCGSAQLHNYKLQTDPSYAQKMTDFENHVQSIKSNKNNLNVASGTVYKIPTVVHVMHKGEAIGTGTNISEDAIQNAIKYLNQFLRKVPGTLGDGNGVDTEIEYSLAVRDPNGNCTNGITRTNMSSYSDYMSYGVQSFGSVGMPDLTLKGLINWNQNQYYNIWLVSEIDDNNGGSGTQGYAYFASSHGNPEDGTIMLATNFLSSTSKTLVHELGHSLDLYHTFEGDNNGTSCPSNSSCSTQGDRVCDTPPHIRSNFTCASGTNACDGGSSNDLFMHNYMDYSSDGCSNMLTAGQKTRMIAAITGARASFLASNGNMALVPVSTAGVDFESSASVLCGTGQSVTFIDKSTCIPNTYISSSSFPGITHSWTITNGTNTYTSSAQNPVITFNNSGTFDVTLDVTTTQGTTSLTKTGLVVISSAPTIPCTPTSNNELNYSQTINNVKFNTINNTTSSSTNVAFTDFACTNNTIVNAGSPYVLSVSAKSGGSGPESFEVYIDYNNNNSFNDSGELIFSGSTPNSSSNTHTVSVTIPLTATINTLLRMRVIGEASTITAAKRSCSTDYFIGDVEDYGVYIKPACSTPTITLSASNNTVCANTTVTLTASGANSYTWNPGGLTGTTVTVTPTGNTTYSVVGAVDACSSNKQISITVNPTPTLTLNSPSVTICTSETATLSATGATSYTWMPGNLTTGTITVSPVSMTVYTVTGLTGNCTSTATSTVNVSGPPSVSVTATSPVCSGQTATLTATGASSYTWNPGNLTGTSVTVTPSSTTVYTVTGANGSCTDVKQYTLSVTPTPTVSVTSSSTTLCASETATLTLSGATSFTVNPGGLSGTSVPVSPTTSTTYTVLGTTSACNGSNTILINVTPSPTITITNTTPTICSSTSTTLSVTGATSYTWMPGNLTGSTVTVTPTSNTTYTVSGSNGGCAASSVTSVSVIATPTLVLSSNNASVCASVSTSIDATGASSYTWNPGNYTGASYTVNPTSTTVYTVTGSNGSCTGLSNYTITVLPTPTVTATSASICSGQTATLTANGASLYIWSPGGLPGAGVNVSPSVTTTYTVTGSNGSCSSSAIATVSVTPSPTLTISSPNSNICSSNSTTLSVIGATSYTWMPGNITTASTTVAPTATTIYTVTGLDNGCSTIKQHTVTVTPTPTLTVNSPTLCSGNSVALTANGGNSYTWTPSGANTTSVSVSPNSTTIYTVSSANNSCIGSQTATVTVIASPTITITSPTTTICSSKSNTLSATGATSYTWMPGALTNGTVTVTPNTTTVYTVTGASNNCSSLKQYTITVVPSPSLSASNATVCSGNATTISVSGAGSYTWTPGGLTNSSISVSPSATTIYTVSGLANGCTSTKQVTVTVSNTPTLTVSAPSNTVCGSQSTTLTVSGASSYTWNPGGFSGTQITVSPNSTTVYTVNGTDAGCSSSKTHTLYVDPNLLLSVNSATLCAGKSIIITATGATSYTWMPGGIQTASISAAPSSTTVYTVTGSNNGCTSKKTANVTVVTCTDIEAVSLFSNYAVYPNPANGSLFINLTLENPLDINVSLHNLMGQELISKSLEKFDTGIISLDISTMAPGIYYLKLGNNQKYVTQKIVVE